MNPDGSNHVSCDALTSVFGLLGKRWTGPIIGTLVANGPSRFSEIARGIPGVSERMLSSRLTELIEAGLVERRVLEGPPVGVEYQATPKGTALRPALDELQRWAEEWLGADHVQGACPETLAEDAVEAPATHSA